MRISPAIYVSFYMNALTPFPSRLSPPPGVIISFRQAIALLSHLSVEAGYTPQHMTGAGGDGKFFDKGPEAIPEFLTQALGYHAEEVLHYPEGAVKVLWRLPAAEGRTAAQLMRAIGVEHVAVGADISQRTHHLHVVGEDTLLTHPEMTGHILTEHRAV